MRVLVAGATGALGQVLIPKLVQRGHVVIGITRSEAKRHRLERLGASSIVANALDAAALSVAVESAFPSHMVHFLTAIPPEGAIRPRDMRATNALRTIGTSNLLRAAKQTGVRRIVAESFACVYGVGESDTIYTEDAPLQPVSNGPFRDTIVALRRLEDQLQKASQNGDIETVSLRFGYLHGAEVPSTVALVERLRRGRFMVPRGATGIGSFIHTEDAATATVAALESPAPAPVYNVVDDEPIPLLEYFDLAAKLFAAPRVRQVPLWLLKWIAPMPAVLASARLRLSNARAKSDLAWRLEYRTPLHGLLGISRQLEEGG